MKLKTITNLKINQNFKTMMIKKTILKRLIIIYFCSIKMTSKLRDFNLLKMADISSNSTNNNNVSVVVNTRELTESINQESSKSENQEMETELKFYKLLSKTLSNILKDNNPKLIINLIDQSGKIIIEAAILIELIAIKANVEPHLVNLQYEEIEEPTCLNKVSPIKNIKNIKIDNETFSLKFNREFNIIQDEFNISLEKVIIQVDLSKLK